jgi:hypothetical protein
MLASIADDARPIGERLDAAGRLRNWLDAVCFGLTNELLTEGGCVESQVADTQRSSHRSAGQMVERSRTAAAAPLLAEVVAEGSASVEHVDTLSRGLRRLEPCQRQGLIDQQATLAAIARHATPEQFERAVNSRVRALQAETDREARLLRQRRAARLRTWVDRDSGMWCVRGEFDPETGLRLHQVLDQHLAQHFAACVPDTAPDDPRERNHHLLAHVLIDLLTNPQRRGALRSEVIVTLRPDGQGATAPDWALPVELPLDVLSQIVSDPATLITPIVVSANGLVLHAPGVLNLGRSTRLANRAQRRALQACHATCSVNGCHVPFDRCKIHHIVWWRHGGLTDLDNLTPLCNRHHTDVHLGRITIESPDDG